jgi:hypothetical protein
MRRSISVPISFLLLMLMLTACSRSSQNSPGESATKSATSPEGAKISSETLVKASAQPVEIPADGSAEAIVRVTVQNGYHINANPPTYPYLKATELDIPETKDISVNYTYYPNPLVKKFSFAEMPLRVYEGETALRVSLQAAKTAVKGEQSLSGTLRIQACDDQVCYPPGSIAVAIPVLIK